MLRFVSPSSHSLTEDESHIPSSLPAALRVPLPPRTLGQRLRHRGHCRRPSDAAFRHEPPSPQSGLSHGWAKTQAMADVLNLLVGIVEWLPLLLLQYRGWKLAEVLCPVCRYLECVFLFASISTQIIVCIERFSPLLSFSTSPVNAGYFVICFRAASAGFVVDASEGDCRYIAIVHPIKARELCSRRNVLFSLALAWTFSLAFAAPYALFHHVNAGQSLREVPSLSQRASARTRPSSGTPGRPTSGRNSCSFICCRVWDLVSPIRVWSSSCPPPTSVSQRPRSVSRRSRATTRP